MHVPKEMCRHQYHTFENEAAGGRKRAVNRGGTKQEKDFQEKRVSRAQEGRGGDAHGRNELKRRRVREKKTVEDVLREHRGGALFPSSAPEAGRGIQPEGAEAESLTGGRDRCGRSVRRKQKRPQRRR